MILGIQIVGVLFGLAMLYITFLHGKRKEFTSKEGIFWIVAWVGFIILVVFPNVLDFIASDLLNISRTLDFLIILGFIFLIGISFYNYVLIRKGQKKLEDLVRKLALKK
ncbi:MAG TPA: DUF2304 domain-containing protein [Candidatus Nanoarchaeia archaeon]|nr:DUF2304 domain-containing protein [Candidatus Nanoarchaeia archaeon]